MDRSNEALAEEAKINAETTADPNRRRALRVAALKYRRLADFVRKTPKPDLPHIAVVISRIEK
jgi:hypothetical protein